LGTREFAAHFDWVALDAVLPQAIGESRDLGLMLWDIDHAQASRPSLFFRAKLENGVMRVPGPDSAEVLR
jgi:CRISPR-associated protein Cas5d